MFEDRHALTGKFLFCSALLAFLTGCYPAGLRDAPRADTFTCPEPADGSSVILKRGDDAKDRSIPAPVTLRWATKPDILDGMTFDVFLSRKNGFTDADAVARNTAETCIPVVNLEIGADYRWQVAAKKNGRIVYKSPVWLFRTPAEPPRWIEVEGLTNFRDMGGWTTREGYNTRQGLLYRGSGPNYGDEIFITPKGTDTLVKSLKIKTEVDLREDGKAAINRVNYIKIPVNAYFGIAQRGETGRDGYRRVFRELAKRKNYPVYFHCQAGADRAGTVAFLTGALLNQRFDDIIKDYELTSLSLSGKRVSASVSFQSFLEYLDSFGEKNDSLQFKVYRYLLDIGVTEKEIASIFEILSGRKFKVIREAADGYEIILPDGDTAAKKDYTVPWTKKAVKADADFSDWTEYLLIEMPGEDTLAPDAAKWNGNDDCSARFFLAYDLEYFYIGAEVRDDIFKNERSESGIWDGDAIQVAFAGMTGKNSYDYELGFALTKKGPQVFCWFAPSKELTGLRDDIPLTVKRVEKNKTTFYETAVPFKYLGISEPGHETALRFNFVALDDDTGTGQSKHLALTAGIVGGKSSRLFRKFTLEQ